MPTPAENLRLAKRGPIVNIIAYLTISAAKLKLQVTRLIHHRLLPMVLTTCLIFWEISLC